MRDTAVLNELSGGVIGAAIEVHRELGPGLLEQVYVECLARELTLGGYQVQREIEIPVLYKGERLTKPLRLDLLVENELIVEAKASDALLPVHSAQLLTYLKMTGCKLGLLLNFNVDVMHKGVKRVVNGF